MTNTGEEARRKVTHVNAVIRRVQRTKVRRPQEILDAIGALDEAVGLFQGSQSTRELLITAARALQLKGDLYLRLPKPDDALDAYDMAEDLFTRADGDSEDFGRFLHDMSIFYNDHGLPQPAMRYARRSRDVLIRFGSKYQRDLDRWIGLLSSLTEQTSPATPVPETRRRVLGARGRERAYAAQARAVQLLNEPNVHLHADEIARSLHSAYRQISKKQESAEDACHVLLTTLDLHWAGLDMPDWALEAARAAMAAADTAGRVDLVGDMLTVEAACLFRRRREEALEIALRAIARHDEHMLATESAAFRMLTGLAGQGARAIALDVAVAAEDGALAAELIEGARLQVEPGEADPEDTDPSRRRSRIRGLRPVSVSGFSRLAGHYSPGVAGPSLSLEATINAVGGEDAAWWGTWGANATMYWALFLDGRWTCGALSLADGTGAGSLLARSMDVSMHNPRATVNDLITGDWCRSVAAEERISTELGQALIPVELRLRLLETAGIRPLSLVIAGNFTTLPPLPILGLSKGSSNQPVRLIEKAVLRMAPPAVLVERAMKSPAQAGENHPVRVACLDPTNELDNSREVPNGAQIILSGHPADGYRPASLDRLAGALGGSAPGAPGLFYYAGHASTHNRSDAEDALPLSGGSALSAHLLFGPRGEEFPFPARSIICACRSSGVSGGGAGEWLGLTAAILWRGGRQVVATNWAIWDTPFTSTFDLSLADRLQTAADVAVALRDSQIEALNNWRSSMHDYTDWTWSGLPESDGNLAFPLIWAAYCCVGTQS